MHSSIAHRLRVVRVASPRRDRRSYRVSATVVPRGLGAGDDDDATTTTSRRAAWIAGAALGIAHVLSLPAYACDACKVAEVSHGDDVRKWPTSTRVYELDTTSGLSFEEAYLKAHGTAPFPSSSSSFSSSSTATTIARPSDATVSTWRLDVPSGVSLRRTTMTHTEQEKYGLDALYQTEDGGSVGVSVWPLPPERATEPSTVEAVRDIVENMPVVPNVSMLRDAKALLDQGATGGGGGGEGGKMFTFAYDLGGGADAPSYVAVNALTHDGKMYVVHATSPGGKTAAKDLRAIADSFRVG
jgi:hypothetical protein